MPPWSQILTEIQNTRKPSGEPDVDKVRRKYLARMHEITGRAAILYATAWTESREIPTAELSVGHQDIQAFMEAVSTVTERELDLIIHSPGGSAEAAESIVEYLRQRFDHIRVFVPIAAMSAATMIALSADEIIMGQHSQLGPIDPQFIISTPEGSRSAPAKAILNQFELAKEQCKDTANLPAWMPILRTYAPGLLTQCIDSQKLASSMVAGWLERYMFDGDECAKSKAAAISQWFADYESFNSHGRRVGREQARDKGVIILDLEVQHDLQDAVLSAYHATAHTFSGTTAFKIVENHNGNAWIRTGPRPNRAQNPPMQEKQATPPQNRAERRRQEKAQRRR